MKILIALLFAVSASAASYRIGTCDWSIKMPLSLEAFDFAQESGLTGIQYSFDVADKGHDLRLRENRDALRSKVEETGVALASLGLGVLNRTPLATEPEAEKLVAECLEVMALLKQEAAALEDRELAAKVSPRVLLLAFFSKGNIKDNPEGMAAVIEKLKRLAPMAEKQGFVLGLETLLSEAEHRHIIDSVGSPAVKVYYDTANSARMGYDIYKEIESLGVANICEVHLKENGNLQGKGDIDFPRVKRLLDGMGFEGWLIIEGSTPKGMDRRVATAKNADFANVVFGSLLGDWSLQMESGEPAWMRVGEDAVHMRIYVGPAGPFPAKLVDGRLEFVHKRKKAEVSLGIVAGQLDGVVTRQGKAVTFTGIRIAAMPPAPDLAKVRFGEPIALFNGQDLSGWRPHESDKINGWSAADGLLMNTTPKTDFSATGAHANLRTDDVFEDFRLHIEFLVGAQRNSGVYLRGMYEAQVVDRDSRMQGIQGVGAIFGKIAPSTNAGRVGGEWQTYDLTLVDRHVTVVLNDVKVIDNQPIDSSTAGAIYTNPMAPGPIYLQGDHTAVKYRNIVLTPVLK